MTTLQFVLLMAVAVGQAVAIVLHAYGMKNAKAEKVAEEIDAAEAAVKPIVPAVPAPKA